MAMMEISVVPVGTATASISDWVARAVSAAKDAGLETYVAPMSTQIQGGAEELLALAATMHRSAFDDNTHRVITTIRIDERNDKMDTPEHRVRVVQDKVQQPETGNAAEVQVKAGRGKRGGHGGHGGHGPARQ